MIIILNGYERWRLPKGQTLAGIRICDCENDPGTGHSDQTYEEYI